MPEIRLHDTLSGELRELEPRRPPAVGIYACGPTTYARIHIGNARPFVIFSLLRRFLAHQGFHPRLVINVTDINDKIYAAAEAAGRGSAEFAAEMSAAYVADTDRLGLGRPDDEPYASATMDRIVALISDLIDGGHAYESGGDVYFRVRSFEGYGKLSNRSFEQMEQGEEAGSSALKEDELDFALWKAHKEGEDTSWPSPWGPGRPGWHIECSAMAEEVLGTDFEVHGGGSDLVFPHHENEIAQTEAARGEPLARIWMHNGMVQSRPGGVDTKMAKSVGNVFLLHEALDRYGPEAVVNFLISGHYRQPLVFGEDALEQAVERNRRIREFFRAPQPQESEGSPPEPRVNQVRDAFIEALADDFNTPRAMAEIYELIREANTRPLPGAHATVAELLEIVGLESLEPSEHAAGAEAEGLLAEREQARGAKDFARADEIRDRLAEIGWEVRDSPDGALLVRRSGSG